MRIQELFEMYTAYQLDDNSRAELMKRFPPAFPDVIGHHVTVEFGVPKDTEAPQPTDIQVVGHATDKESIEALVVSVNGTTRRPDGKIFHITWSLDRSKGRKPVDSNGLLEKYPYDTFDPIPINTTPKVLK